ncbi:uncharacterized protein [Montipora foliosa]|uniref:uncharacterized protein n=1 Tax=Montipora foliosa TaxID=591990 RepID=UPI0035F141DB
MAKHQADCSNSGEDFGELSFSALELQALNYLDESIRFHDTQTEDNCFNNRFGSESRLMDQRNLSNQVFRTPRESQAKTMNAGYILVDGCEMKYVSSDKSEDVLTSHDSAFTINGSFEEKTWESSSKPSSAHASQITLITDGVITRALPKDSICRLSLTPYKRLPSCVHFTTLQKLYFIAVGAAPMLTFNASLISVAFFLPILGNHVLSKIGICHHIPFLAAMLLILCGKKHWVPFLPTVPICLVLMIVCGAVIPGLVLAGFTTSIFTIYGVVTLNGWCAGLSLSLLGRVIVLFPGGEVSSLIRYGESLGIIFPVVLQIVLILSTGLNSTNSPLTKNNELCLLALFGAVSMAILLGLIALITLSRSGIYELFAGRDCAAHSSKNITLGSVPQTTKRRYHAVKWCLFAAFTVSLESYYVLSLSPFTHEATIESSGSSIAPFWKNYLVTVLVGVFRLGNVLGGLLFRLRCFDTRLNSSVATFCYLSAAILCVGFVIAVALFIRAPFLLFHNFFTIAIYFTLALSNSFLYVAMASSCQSFIMGQRKDTCPIVSQLVWLAEVLGATVGIALSFIPLTI